MTRALVIQTQDDAPAGRLEGWAARRGIELHTVRAEAEELPPPDAFDCAIALGSRETARGDGPEWVAREIDWLRAADGAGLPVLGICFGAQALASALGGSVRRLERAERGWSVIASNDPERVPAGPWIAWHEDGIVLPPLAYELARNEFGVQAFCHCRHLAVQFHPEATPAIAAGWASRNGIELDPAAHADTAAQAAEILFDGFASRAGLVAVASRS